MLYYTRDSLFLQYPLKYSLFFPANQPRKSIIMWLAVWNDGCRRGDSGSVLNRQYLCIVSSPRLNRDFSQRKGLGDSSFDSLSDGVPPKSPDHSDVNTSHISIQTHQEAHRLTMSGDVWYYRHPPETSAGELAPPQRFDSGGDIPPHTSVS